MFFLCEAAGCMGLITFGRAMKLTKIRFSAESKISTHACRCRGFIFFGRRSKNGFELFHFFWQMLVKLGLK